MEAKEVQEKVDELLKSSIMHVGYWWGGMSTGRAGYLIDENWEVYSYMHYFYIPENKKDFCINYFKKENVEAKNLKKKLDDYFEENINGKDFPEISMFDASYIVKTKDVFIRNYTEIYKDIEKIIKEEIKKN